MDPTGAPPPPRPPARAQRWGEAPNPTTYPSRHTETVEREVQVYEAQRAELEAETVTTGQAGALVVVPVAVRAAPGRGSYSWTTWTEGRVSVLAPADVLVLHEQPKTIEDRPVPFAVRWDVVERICRASCWSPVPGVTPPRVITRRWPTPDELEAVRALRLPDPPGSPR